VPPVPEQQAIADHVTTARHRLDVAVDRVSLQVGRLREYRQALITAAVTGKVDVT
jgi:hypothetical protein